MADSVKAFIHVGFAAAIATVFALPQTAHAQHASPALSLAASAKGTAQRVWHDTQDVAIFALGLLGVDYGFGGTTPERGLDCSGLVRYVFQQVTGVVLPRTSSEMSRLGDRVDVSELRMGDLVFFNTRRLSFSHVGIYLGDSRFIHAPSRGNEVAIADLSQAYWRKHWNGARRLVGVLPSLSPIGRASAATPLLPVDVTAVPSALDAPLPLTETAQEVEY